MRNTPGAALRFGSLGVLMLSASLAFAQKGNSTASANNRWSYAGLAQVPEKARARSNPLESDPDALAAGRKLFKQHCAVCHGDTADGTRKAPSLRAEEVRQAQPGTLFWILTNGVLRRGMPAWSKLPEAQRWQIVTSLKSFKDSGPQ